jgi:uncharacterized protein (DUF983 family)
VIWVVVGSGLTAAVSAFVWRTTRRRAALLMAVVSFVVAVVLLLLTPKLHIPTWAPVTIPIVLAASFWLERLFKRRRGHG